MRSKKKQVTILVLNCGSSSLKYKIIRMPDERELVSGEAERVGIKTQGVSSITHTVLGRKRTVEAILPDHSIALQEALRLIGEDAKRDRAVTFDAFAHRYVHPGSYFTRTTKVTKPVIARLKETLPLAAIHNPVSFALIEFCRKRYRSVDQFVVFDTAFHKTIPPEYATYALPLKVARRYGLRRIGFHGISHRYVMEEACKTLGRDRMAQRIISCHLGTGGSSVCAISGGKSVNSSMGFTPLEGLMMNTRCGDVDPGLVFSIMSRNGLTADEAERILNKKSGVLGVCSTSSDLRDVIRDMHGNRQARMAFDMYVRRVRTYIGYYALILKKADLLLFTDSLGVGSPVLREAVCRDMDIFGIAIDEKKNACYDKGTRDISSPRSGTRVLVVPTDEEIMIAREAYKELCTDDTRR